MAALGEVETYAQARRRRGQEWVTTANFAAVRFDHLAARPSRTGTEKGYAPDPQLHTHVVIANLTQRPDGAWRSLEPLEIYRSQSWATAVYRSHLAERLGQLGYGIEPTGRRGEWELAGYTRDQIMEFSNRRQDIEQELERMARASQARLRIPRPGPLLSRDHQCWQLSGKPFASQVKPFQRSKARLSDCYIRIKLGALIDHYQFAVFSTSRELFWVRLR
jgi:hypothetical protein